MCAFDCDDPFLRTPLGFFISVASHAARNAALASSRLTGTPPFGTCVGAQTRARALLRAPWRGRLAGWPNVRLPLPIAAFRAQGWLRQLSATSGLYVEGQRPSRRAQHAGRLCPKLTSRRASNEASPPQILASGRGGWRAPSRFAQTRPVRFIVPFPPGGGNDYAARVVAGYMSRVIGQQVFVENKSGAGGLIGIETAAKSSPDGYTVLITTDALASVPAITNLNTDYIKDLVPVIHLTSNPVILAVHTSLGVTSVDELIRAAKLQPGMSYATSGIGSQQHFAGEWFARIAGIKLDNVPYRGAGQAINDLSSHACSMTPFAIARRRVEIFDYL